MKNQSSYFSTFLVTVTNYKRTLYEWRRVKECLRRNNGRKSLTAMLRHYKTDGKHYSASQLQLKVYTYTLKNTLIRTWQHTTTIEENGFKCLRKTGQEASILTWECQTQQQQDPHCFRFNSFLEKRLLQRITRLYIPANHAVVKLPYQTVGRP